MRGHIKKRGKSYCVVVDIGRDSSGKRKQKWFSGYKTKREAEKAASEIIAKIENDNFVVPKKTTFEEYLKIWLNLNLQRLSPTTYKGYEIIINRHLIPELGNIPLQKLKPIHLQKYYNKKMETLKGKTLLQHHRVIRKSLDYAYKMQAINKNPADLIDPPKVKKFNSKVLTPKEAKMLLQAIKDTRFELPINLALSLGLRRGEILGLRWEDIDYDKETLTIRQTLVRAGTELIFKSPKTEESERTLALPKELIKLLKKHKKKQLEMQIRLNNNFNKRNLVCIRDNGEPINPATFSHAFGDFLKSKDLPKVRLHDLRHTNATFMLLNGTSPKVASSRLGHSTINVTMDLYSHVLEDMEVEAANKLNDVLYK